MDTMNGIQPMYDLADQKNGGFGEGWIWVILIFLFLGFGGNGFGGNNTQDQFLTRDLFNMQQANANCCCETQKEIIDSRYTTQLGLQNLGQQLASCCCETNRNIDAVRADAYKNTCDITTAIHSEGEATRALINANTVQDLRDKLNDRDRDLLVAELAFRGDQNVSRVISSLQPTPKPAYLTCSPYFTYGAYGNTGNYGCNGCGNL